MKSLLSAKKAMSREESRRRFRMEVESLESRLVLSTAHHAIPLSHAVHPLAATVGTIKGRITNDATGRGMASVKVQLFDANNQVVATTRTGCRGYYAFQMKATGAYVVHAVTPKQFTQTSPRFSQVEPEGSYAINPATGQPYGSSSWSYRTGNSNPANGPVGPPFWGTVAPAGNEPFESPINITGAPIDLSQYLTIKYDAAVPKAIVNNGAQIQVQFNATGHDTINLDGYSYDLKQFHFHDTSENTVNGASYSMESHFVNLSSTGAETVVAVFMQLGAHNDALQPILDAATAYLATPGSSYTPTTPIDFAGLLPSSLQGWFYSGSLTTPPLSQVVNFLVLATPITLDYAQLIQYEQVANGSGFLPNNRPVQPLDGRAVNQFNINVNYAGGDSTGNRFTFARTSSVSTANVGNATHVHARSNAVTQYLVRPTHHS